MQKPPFEILPRDIWNTVFGFFTLPKDKARLSQVCSGFHDLLRDELPVFSTPGLLQPKETLVKMVVLLDEIVCLIKAGKDYLLRVIDNKLQVQAIENAHWKSRPWLIVLPSNEVLIIVKKYIQNRTQLLQKLTYIYQVGTRNLSCPRVEFVDEISAACSLTNGNVVLSYKTSLMEIWERRGNEFNKALQKKPMAVSGVSKLVALQEAGFACVSNNQFVLICGRTSSDYVLQHTHTIQAFSALRSGVRIQNDHLCGISAKQLVSNYNYDSIALWSKNDESYTAKIYPRLIGGADSLLKSIIVVGKNIIGLYQDSKKRTAHLEIFNIENDITQTIEFPLSNCTHLFELTNNYFAGFTENGFLNVWNRQDDGYFQFIGKFNVGKLEQSEVPQLAFQPATGNLFFMAGTQFYCGQMPFLKQKLEPASHRCLR